MKVSILVIIMITLMIGVIAISGTQQTAFAENKAKEYCSDYGGEWDNGKCKIEDDEDKADYEDDVCDDAEDSKKYKKICNP
jgi:Na+/H+-translocating membrane pyrophosphatase